METLPNFSSSGYLWSEPHSEATATGKFSFVVKFSYASSCGWLLGYLECEESDNL
jgi:hypothetical protein